MSLPFPLNCLPLTEAEAGTCHKILQGTGGWIARNLNKRISLPISIYLYRAGVSPNQITFFNLLLGIAAGVFAAWGSYKGLFLGGLLFQLVSIFDGCDGEVAKLSGRSTRFGAWFDTVGDNLSFVVFIVGVTLGLYTRTHQHWIIIAAEISLVSFAMLISVMVAYLIKQKGSTASLVTYEKEVVSESIEGQRSWAALFVRYGKFLVKKDFFAFLFFSLSLLDLAQVIVFLAALGTSAVALSLMVINLKKYKASKILLEKKVGQE